MSQSFSAVISILVSIFLFFGIPFLYAEERLLTVEQYYVQSECIKLVDSVCNTGFLSKEMYEEFERSISTGNQVYEVKLEAKRDALVLADQASLSVYSEYADTEEIIDTLETAGRYEFAENDLLRVEVVCTRHSFPSFFESDGSVTAWYGGRIKYEVD